MAGQALERRSRIISLITEPHTVAGKLHSFPNRCTKIYRRPLGSDDVPRAAIVASKDLGLTTLEAFSNRDCAAGIFKLSDQRIVVASVYLDITKPAAPPWLEQLVEYASRKSYALLIGMDSNAHSSLWGPDSNARGNELEDFILQHGLHVENRGTEPTFETRRGHNLIQTHIDITLTRDLPLELENWTVDRSYNASDHNNLTYELTEESPSKTKIRPWSKADWTVFKEYLANAQYAAPETMTMKKLDKLVDHMYMILEKALDKACPKIAVSTQVPNGHWATETHAKAREEVSRLYKIAKTRNATPDWEAYKQADKSFKAL